MKKILKQLLVLIVLFSFNLVVKADLQDYSGGGSGNTGNLSSGGSWYTGSVGLKVSIVNSSGGVDDVEIFLNENGKGGANFSYENKPKTHQSTKITWKKAGDTTTYNANFLPKNWRKANNDTIDLYNILSKDNYTNLKSLINHSSLKSSVGSGDYIYVEPMVRIGSYYGTAFEMTNAFLKNNECTTNGKFCYNYSTAVFGGNNKGKLGVLYTTLYVSSKINGVDTQSGGDRNARNNCFKKNNCGRGIGIFKYDDIYPQGKVKITIYDNVTKKAITNPNRQAKYQIYSGNDCNGTKVGGEFFTSSSTKTIDLSTGTYSIKEITQPSGYVASSDKCVKKGISITSGNTTNADIYYEPTCQVELEDSDKSVGSLMNLYNKYQKRGLLNFNNPTCSNNKEDLCKIIKLNKNNLGCLNATSKLNTIFDESNLSCYDEIVSSNSGSIGFCVNNFSLQNNLGTSNFSAKAGQFLIKKEQNESIATATTQKICYIYNKDLYSSYMTLKDNKLSFGDNNDDGKADELKNYQETITQNLNIEANAYFRKYVYAKNKNYYLNEVYFEKLNGKYSSVKSNDTTQIPEYAVLAKFKQIDSYIPFELIYENKTYNSEECKYKTTEEIITYEENENGKIDLEYRIIDTKNPFDRETNSNWCASNGDCSKNNELVTKIIKESNNSYNITGAGPLYKIVLTPSDVKKIREYNKDNKYSYYNTLSLPSGEVVNSFVYDLKQGVLNKYKKNGSMEKQYGVLQNKLITK